MSEQLQFEDEYDAESLGKLWQLCFAMLSSRVSEVVLSGFLKDAVPVRFAKRVFVLGASTPFARDYISRKAANAIRSALEFHLDTSGIEVEVTLIPGNEQHSRRSQKDRSNGLQQSLPLDEDTQPQDSSYSGIETGTAVQNTLPQPAKSEVKQPASSAKRHTKTSDRIAIGTPLNAKFSFDKYMVGHCNRLAFSSALTITDKPGDAYNPLYIYGGPGLGKTHLLQAAAHALREKHPDKNICYVSCENFVQQYVTAIKQHTTEEFRKNYRQIDVWLVDDIQFIMGKGHNTEEFFHTFDTLHQSNRQIVIASDRSPRELSSMDERLRSRFQSGLIADISAPELETRIAILKQFRDVEQAPIQDEVLEYIGSAIQSSIRALQGAVTRLVAISSIMKVPVTLELAQGALTEYLIDKPFRTRVIKVSDIIKAVSEKFGITESAMLSPVRHKDVSLARQTAIYICRELLPEMSTTHIGEAFGGRDHATIVYATKQIRKLFLILPEHKAMVEKIIREIQE